MHFHVRYTFLLKALLYQFRILSNCAHLPKHLPRSDKFFSSKCFHMISMLTEPYFFDQHLLLQIRFRLLIQNADLSHSTSKCYRALRLFCSNLDYARILESKGSETDTAAIGMMRTSYPFSTLPYSFVNFLYRFIHVGPLIPRRGSSKRGFLGHWAHLVEFFTAIEYQDDTQLFPRLQLLWQFV